jgi:hypothetical protein
MKFVLFGFIWGAGFSMAVTAWLMDQNILTPNNASVIFSVGVAILVILLVIQITVLITRRKR